MAKYILRPPEPRCSPIEDVLHDAEELLGVQLTLHDLASVFVDTEGRRLLGRWRGSHRRYETCARSHCRRCLDHCYGEVNRTAARSDGPFVHRCWRGLVEVVLPICQEGVHVATLFAGQWRSHGVGKRCPAYVRAVPVAKADDLRRMGRLMQAVADGLPAELRRVQGDVGRPATRGEEIRRFIRLHAAQPVRLSELARSLHLSPSRTSHLVREATGRSFQTLLLDERLRKARALLRSTDLPIREVGRLSGFDNPYYFSRLFRQRTGRTASVYRADGPGSPS